MYGLAEGKWKLPVAWRQLVPLCSQPGCTTGTSWTGVLHRVAGFWVNERDWFCSSRCLEAAMEEHLLDCFFEDHRPAPIRTTMPMGLMMLARGVISDTQLRSAIEMQRNSGDKIGACLRRLGSILTTTLLRWSRPSGGALYSPRKACSQGARCYCR